MHIDYESFNARWSEEEQGITAPVLHQYVDHIDENGLVLKTNQMEPNPMTQYQKPESDLSKKARKAVKKQKKD